MGMAGDYVFNCDFDIEVGPFDENGFAETRAVDWDGNDITSEVSRFGLGTARKSNSAAVAIT